MLRQLFNKWKYGIISLAILFLLLVLGTFFVNPNGNDGTIIWKEDPINKTHALLLKPGETYVYSYTLGNNSINLTYKVKGAKNCTTIDIVNGTEHPFCINNAGNDKNMSNLSLMVPFYNIFRPWMLAVEDGWSWGINGKINVSGSERIFYSIKLKTLGKEQFKGRTAYKVVIEENGIVQTYFLIDEEKRILLKESGKGYEIILVSAPFSLQQ